MIILVCCVTYNLLQTNVLKQWYWKPGQLNTTKTIRTSQGNGNGTIRTSQGNGNGIRKFILPPYA